MNPKQLVDALLTEAPLTKHDLGIVSISVEPDIEDWITDWEQENASSVGIWGNEEIWEEIRKLAKSGAKFVLASVPNMSYAEPEDRGKTTEDYLETGKYRLVAEEDNMWTETQGRGSYEGILVKIK